MGIMTKSLVKVQKGWAASRERANRLAKKIADPARKVGTTALAAAGGATSGYVRKWGTESGKKLTVGTSQLTYTALAGGVLAVGGAMLGAKAGSAEASYAMHGIGTGMLASEIGFLVAGM